MIHTHERVGKTRRKNDETKLPPANHRLVLFFLLFSLSAGRVGGRRGPTTIKQGLSRSVYVTASLMMAQLTHKPETLEGYLLTLGWLFASFVLAASYTAELASFLTATKLATAVSVF